MQLKKFLPILEWLPAYKTEDLKGDLAAGLTVGVMLIPQGMAYAMIAGLPPIYGLYASTIPLIIYSLFGTSRQLAVGPVAMVSLLTAAGIGAIAEGGTETYIALAITLALFVGLIQFLLGAFRLGFLVNFLSHPVISGFTSAAALIIGLSQLKHLLGVNIPRSHHIHEILIGAVERFGEINWATFLIGLGGIALIMGIKRINRAIPGPLLAVIFGILAVWGLGLTGQGVKIVGEVPKGLPSFGIPSLNMESFSALLPAALAIALVSFMESIAVAKAIQAKHKNYKVDANQELIGLGLANIGGSFFQSYPVTGGFSRTAVNDQAGARTGLAAIISAVLIALTLLFLTGLFYYLPNAILASVIMVAVFGLIDIKEAVHLWHADRSDFWMLIVTFIGTLALGIEQGILIGVVLSIAIIIFRTTMPHFAVLGKIPGKPHYKNITRFDDLEVRDDILIMRFDARLYFANVNYFKEKMEEEIARKGKKLKLLILDANSINGLDSSGMHALEEIIDFCHAQGIEFDLASVKGPVRDILVRGGLIDKIGEDNFFMRVQHAVDSFDEKGKERYEKYVLQTNE
ncbi:MAG: solute carrier family 26 protein [Lewinellaceae bacterium]|nr:solute carrier family 26 protein [Lewinellaceae bacterium]MCB9290675.1 solute carrier family 26 protein [Lewinellaceae bacterium]